MLSGQIDAMGGGDYGDIYLHKSAKGEDFEIKYVLRSFYFGIGVAQGQPRAAAVAQHLRLHVKNDGTLEALSQKYRKAPLPALPVF